MAITNARILIRRGNEVDFDAYNMQPGEWALSTDEKIVRICVAPGVCIRMATYDAFEADMAKIEAILAECRDIKTVVNRINDEVSANAKAVAEYTEQAKQYRDEAEQFRNEAEAFSPEGYSELVQNVEKNTVKIDTILEKGGLTFDESASGENIHRTDTTDNKVTAFALYGKATQNGTPTPDNPVEINVAGASGSVEVVSCGKNLLKNTAVSKTSNGVTFTVNENDKSIEANGTATENTNISVNMILNKGKYIISGCPSGGSKETYAFIVQNEDFSKAYWDIGNGATIEVEEDNSLYHVYMARVASGVTVFNLKFYPMIRKCDENGNPIGDDIYEHYKETKSTIPTPNGLCGIKVSSGGNYTDENGQQRICDEIVKYADGSGKRVQRIGFLDGNSPWLFSSQKNIAFIRPDDIGFGYTNLKNNADLNYTNRFNLKCTHLVARELGSSIANGCFGVYDYFYIKNESLQDANAYKEWMKANDFKMTYFLPTPIITDLSAEEIAEIEKLQTFYPVTNISNDAGCGMEIAYKADAKNYIDNIILARVATLETAVINNL